MSKQKRNDFLPIKTAPNRSEAPIAKHRLRIILILFLILQIKPISYSELKNRHSSGQVATPVLLSQKIYTIEKNDLRKIQQISMTKVDDSEIDTKTRSRKSSIFVEGLQSTNFSRNQRKISGRTTDLNFSLLKRIS